MSLSEREIAQQSQEKFEFYLVGLVFTLLALSIQTAKFGQSNLSDFFELSGWLSLAVSGLSGLWRLEYIPVIREKLATMFCLRWNWSFFSHRSKGRHS